MVSEKAFAFAVRIVKLCQYLQNVKHEYILSKQLIRSGTSIGANISEAQQGQSRADFVSKMSIALKETAETNIGFDCSKRRIISQKRNTFS